MGISQLLHPIDINDSDLYLHLPFTLPQDSMSSLECRSHHHGEINHDFQHITFEFMVPVNMPKVNEVKFTLFSIGSILYFPVWNKWKVFNVSLHTGYITVFEKLKKLYVHSFKWVDGFKFIIKIPDKPTISFIQ